MTTKPDALERVRDEIESANVDNTPAERVVIACAEVLRERAVKLEFMSTGEDGKLLSVNEREARISECLVQETRLRSVLEEKASE